MPDTGLAITLINGPTALLQLGGLALLTDPTFDPAGTDYPTPVYTLHKTTAPALAPKALPRIDAVLLSHDHHFDNLDHAGRALLASMPVVYTTVAGAERLGGNAVGLTPWQVTELNGLRITATPGRHGPPGGDRGPVIGFVLEHTGSPVVWVSGDTVWYEDVAAVNGRMPIGIACLNMGAAQVQVAGPHPLTFTALDGIALARAWPATTIVPLHCDGWAHFTEGRAEIDAAFRAAGLAGRLAWCLPGQRRAFA